MKKLKKKKTALSIHPHAYPIAKQVYLSWSDDLNNIMLVAKLFAEIDPDRSIDFKRLKNLIGQASIFYIMLKHFKHQAEHQRFD